MNVEYNQNNRRHLKSLLSSTYDTLEREYFIWPSLLCTVAIDDRTSEHKVLSAAGRTTLLPWWSADGFGKQGHRGAEQSKAKQNVNVSYIQVHAVHVCRVYTYKHSRPIQPSYFSIVYICIIHLLSVYLEISLTCVPASLRACVPAIYSLILLFTWYRQLTKGAKVKVPKCFWYRSGKIAERTRPWLARSLVTFLSYLPYLLHQYAVVTCPLACTLKQHGLGEWPY